MMNYTIADFWIPRLGIQPYARPEGLIQGWSSLDEGLATFIEAPLTLSSEFGVDDDPITSSLLLVSAPGAVGKTTLARQIASKVNAVYVDLSEAEPVGANTLIGGIANSGLYESWSNGSVSVLLDGLDEAKLRVTQEAFESFLSDVAKQSIERGLPTVLFGRTGAIQDAWLVLTDHTNNVAVLEIGYYGKEEAVKFAETCLRASKSDDRYAVAERQALDLLVERLRNQTGSDGDRFAGYAPVLLAIAKQVEGESDAQALISRITRGEQSITLQDIAVALLEREQRKIRNVTFEDPSLVKQLYSPDEQLDRLVARLYNCPLPQLPNMSTSDEQAYTTALESWVGEHPFLDGSDGFSSAVFEAMVSTKALRNRATSQDALHKEIGRGAAANPFLFEFYTAEGGKFIQPEHIGAIYASLKAGLALGEECALFVYGPDEIIHGDDLVADVDIVLSRQKQDLRELQFETSSDGTICLGTQVESISIEMPMARVEVGPGSEAVLVNSVDIHCKELSLAVDKVIVENPSRSEGIHSDIHIEAGSLDSLSTPTVVHVRRGKVNLSVYWPGVDRHPWTRFATQPSAVQDPRLDEALRRFRQFVISFRSHGRGVLARSANKIESTRMTKGSGQSVLELMKLEGIVSLQGGMYILDTALLSEITGTNYSDCMARNFSQKAITFVQKALIPAN